MNADTRGGAVAAVDLGATSGRVIVGHVDGAAGTLALNHVARFPNGPVRLASGLHWDFTGLFRDLTRGLADAFRRTPDVASIGVDSWAVDYGLLRGERLLGEPFHYRDERNEAAVDGVHAIVPFAELYRRNGLQFLPFNTVYQLAAERDGGDGCLGLADSLLLIPDLVGFQLTGTRVAERTNASTTGLLGVETGEWDYELMERLQLEASVLPRLVSPGDSLGGLRPTVAADLGAPDGVEVVAVGSHDTASAVVAVPMRAESAAYISCGTWGLVGVELEAPVTSDAARDANFTNEGGVDGRVRFLHNVMGLWLLSESVRWWERDGETIDLPGLLAQAAAVTGEVTVFDANDPRLMAPGDLPGRIAEWCAERGLRAPQSRAEFARSIVESLAEAFAAAVRDASILSGVDVETIHLVGGGSQNALLCQRTADRSGIPVLAGPVEATAIGNVLVQARAAGFASGDLESLRAIVTRAFEPKRYAPRR
ncbi:rhamnulokinase [Agromyces aerolatus]|uniref:rhamnulokinase n=1 Tax=Agromyces sp. LY-1074 TaxID=3074080 RepID=UPI0028561D22|nr:MULTISPECIES: rhamnulokinase family protein [unclassified Agromyces]MDR5700555.1 rhamnulokinase family protein [Agromyces sp. LY-1074]MDR5707076.1 rhamnulokinase family protein [Agromyces sp. LY-1358]